MNETAQETKIETETNEVDYIGVIEDLKANTISRDKYNNLVTENERLLKALINNESIQVVKPSNNESIDKLRQELYNSDKELTNLEYVDKTLKLRKALMDSGKIDPFVPVGHEVDLTQNDFDIAEYNAQVLQEMVDTANESGNDPNIVFTELLKSKVIDSKSLRFKR